MNTKHILVGGCLTLACAVGAYAQTPTPSRPSRNHLGDHDCHIFAFIGGDKPHFLFSTPAGWGRFYINLAHVKHAAADCAKYVASR